MVTRKRMKQPLSYTPHIKINSRPSKNLQVRPEGVILLEWTGLGVGGRGSLTLILADFFFFNLTPKAKATTK